MEQNLLESMRQWIDLKDVNWEEQKESIKTRTAKKGYRLTDQDDKILDQFISKLVEFIKEVEKRGIMVREDKRSSMILWFQEWSQEGKLPKNWSFNVQVDPWFHVIKDKKQYGMRIQVKTSKGKTIVKIHDPNGWNKKFSVPLSTEFENEDSASTIQKALDHVSSVFLNE